MRTLGIDLATRNGTTGICEINWAGDARVESAAFGSPSDDDLARRIHKVIESGGWVAIDAPFGFPQAFTDAVATWGTGTPIARIAEPRPEWIGPRAPWDPINRRLTDGYVHVRLKAARAHGDASVPWPLSAVVERITPTVIRCAELLSQTTTMVDRVGFESRVVEAYPVAALRLWGLAASGYKGANGVPGRQRLLAALQEQMSRMSLGDHEAVLIESDDALDALVCALVARLAAHPDRPSGPEATGIAFNPETIGAEGWIHLPPHGHALDSLLQQEI